MNSSTCLEMETSRDHFLKKNYYFIFDTCNNLDEFLGNYAVKEKIPKPFYLYNTLEMTLYKWETGQQLLDLRRGWSGKEVGKRRFFCGEILFCVLSVSMSISWWCYYAIILQNVTVEGKVVKNTRHLLYYFMQLHMNFNYLKTKGKSLNIPQKWNGMESG